MRLQSTKKKAQKNKYQKNNYFKNIYALKRCFHEMKYIFFSQKGKKI